LAALPNQLKVRKYGGEIHADERDRLRGLWELTDAVRGEKRTKLRDVAHRFAQIEDDQDLWDKIQNDPLLFVQKELEDRAGGGSVVLWRERNTNDLRAGILCDAGMLDAVYVLMLMRIGVGQKGGIAHCIVCGDVLERTRGKRRRTCSDKCRKQASRMKAKASGLRPATRRRRSATA
jgi:hypothetical protein